MSDVTIDETTIAEEPLSGQAILHQMRAEAVQQLLYLISALGFLLLIGGSYAVGLQGRYSLIVFYVAMYLVVLVATFVRGLDYRWRAGLIVVALYALGTFDMMTTSWEEDMRAFYVAFPALATLFFGRKWGFLAVFITTVTLLVPGHLLQSYLVPDLWSPEVRAIRTGGLIVVVMMGAILVVSESIFVEHMSRALEETARRAASLHRMQNELDKQVQAMRDLNYTAQRRVAHLEAGAKVAQVVGSIFDPEQLLERAAFLISQSFGFYHTGIFLVDETEEWAVLRAASSEGGRQMLEHGHRLRRGEGMVGWVLIHREPRVALDVGKDAVHFANPFLPATRSEVALPLMVGNRLIGVLDVQSTEEAAFDQDDVRALTFLAAQLAVAINNALRLRSEAAQLEATSVFYQMVRQLSGATTTRDVYEAMMRTVQDYHPSQAVLYLRDRESGHISVVAQVQGEHLYFPEDETAQEGMEPLLRHLFEVDEPLFLEKAEDVADDEVFAAEWQRMELEDEGGLALIPIHIDERHEAMFYLLYQRRHRFGSVERRLYVAMADMAGTALARTFLLQTVEGAARRERWLYAFTEELMGIFELSLLAENAATILLQYSGAKGVRLDIMPHILSEEERTV